MLIHLTVVEIDQNGWNTNRQTIAIPTATLIEWLKTFQQFGLHFIGHTIFSYHNKLVIVTRNNNCVTLYTVIP